jgi:hypothetical protein
MAKIGEKLWKIYKNCPCFKVQTRHGTGVPEDRKTKKGQA